MNDLDQEIAIAEACGCLRYVSPVNGFVYLCRFPPSKSWTTTSRPFDIVYPDVPGYLNDLNAMHEAEELLNDVQRIHFSTQIMHSHNAKGGRGCSPFDYGHATARQRAEAFLKTLNLWKP